MIDCFTQLIETKTAKVNICLSRLIEKNYFN